MAAAEEEVLPRYQQYPELELIANYRAGGFHPIHLGEVVGSRYRVVHKLGYGAFATVWLVEGTTLKHYAALKILTADASRIKPNRELEILKKIKAAEAAPGSEHVVKLLDDFVIEGPNGNHQCIVTEVLGPSLGSLGVDLEGIYDDDRFPNNICKRMIPQIARGIQFLHDSCGVLHGDLHLGNMLLFHPEMQVWSPQHITKYLGKPRLLRLVREDNVPVSPTTKNRFPRYLVPISQPIPLLHLCLATPESVHMKICDFGEAKVATSFLDPSISKSKNRVFADPPSGDLRGKVPCIYAAPEQLLRDSGPLSFSTDIWALAVLFHMIFSGANGLFPSYYGIEKEVLREMVQILGKFPEEWWLKFEARKEYFDEDGNVIVDKKKLAPISGRFLKVYPGKDLSEGDVKLFEMLLRKMVVYDARQRITAREVVDSIPTSWL